MAQNDTYQAITDRFIAALEAGTKPWERDWLNAGAPLRVTGEEYRGINWALLSLTAEERGFAGRHWMTFNQALELGGSVRKGETSTQVVFFKRLEVGDEADGDGDGEGRKVIPLLRSYRVFNVDQIDGLPDRFAPPAAPELPAKARDEAAEAALRSTGATINEGGGCAYYDRGGDYIQLPPFDAFRSTGGFLATMAHELVHWTGAKSRLDRTFGSRFGDHDYAFEELVAEIGASFVCARLSIAGEHFDNHAAYLASWLKVLRNDKRAIFKAAALAQSAADFVLAGAEAPARPAPVAKPAPAPVAARAVPQLELAL